MMLAFLLLLAALDDGCVVTVPDAFLASGSLFTRKDPHNGSEAIVLNKSVELTIVQSGCAHQMFSFSFRWLKGKPPRTKAAIRTAADLLLSLQPKEEAHRALLLGMADLVRKTTPARLDQTQEMSEATTVVVSFKDGVLTVSYDFAA
jgi:hypothetical protein